MADPITLLVIGGIALMAVAGGKKGTGGYLFDGQCRAIPGKIETEEELAKFTARIMRFYATAWKETWDVEVAAADLAETQAETQAAVQSILGPPPGDRQNNGAFIGIFATGIVKAMSNPACRKRVAKFDQGWEQMNQWGKPNWDELDPGTLPGDLEQAFFQMGQELIVALAVQGYDLGIELSMQGAPQPMVLGMAERIARL